MVRPSLASQPQGHYAAEGIPDGKRYIEREEHGKAHRTRLSRIGELWVRSHAGREQDPLE